VALVEIYLNDHMAGAVAAAALARRAAAANRGNPYGETLEELGREIEEDRAALARVMTELDVRSDPIKLAAAWAAEKLGRLKLNGSLIGYSRLSRLEELELLALGIQGKLAMWRSLAGLPALRRRAERGADLDELIRRARSQLRRIERRRLEAAAEALLTG
jgi:hypothetical protein